MKHIVFLALTLTRGGAERVIANLCNEALSEKYRVSIITCMNKPVGYELKPGIEHICIEKTSDVHYKNLRERFLKRRKLLKKVLEECKPDVLLCFLPEPNFLALSLKKHFDFPMIISVRNDPVKEYKNPVYQAIMRILYPKADGYVFQTEQAKEYFSFSKKIMEKCCVIPNPLAREFMDYKRVPEENRRKAIVNVGKLSSQKNQTVLIQAFSKIKDMFPEYQLHIYGEGDKRNELESLVKDLEMQDRVILKGNVSELSKQIEDAALFVLSSDYEGMPNALMEAMAMGIPCVSTDCPCGGPEFLIQNGENGMLVPVGDVDKLAETMELLLQDRELADTMGHKATQITKTLHPDVVHENWNEYIMKYL